MNKHKSKVLTIIFLAASVFVTAVPVTILHTNDTHGAYLPQNSRFGKIGGYAVLEYYLNAEREKTSAALYLDAGDQQTGSIFASQNYDNAIGGAVISTGRVMIDAINRGLPMVARICDAALTVGKGLGVFATEHNEVDMYELGMRTERAVEEGTTSEQFDNNQAYIDYLREKITLSNEDRINLKNLSDSDKLKYACIGSAMTIATIKEKYEIDIPETFWSTATDLGIQPEKFKPMLDIFENAKLQPDLNGFMKGELSSDLQRSIYDLIDERLSGVLGKEIVDKLIS